MQTDLLSVSINLPLWDISCEWNHTIGSRLLLASFSLCVFEQFLPFLCRLQFHCQDIHLVYPFTKGGDIQIVLSLGAAVNTLLWAFIYMSLCGPQFPFLEWIPKNEMAGLHGKFTLSFWRNCPTGFHAHQRSMRVPGCVHPCQTWYCLFDYSHSSGCIMVSHCGFDLHFPNE